MTPADCIFPSDATTWQYGGMACHQFVHGAAPATTLPFTGAEVIAWLVIAVVLLVSGAVLRLSAP